MPARVRNSENGSTLNAAGYGGSHHDHRRFIASCSYSDGNGAILTASRPPALETQPRGGPYQPQTACLQPGNFLTPRETQSAQAWLRQPCLSHDEKGV